MEHKRFTYEVLVNASSRGLVWRRVYNGHVPDTAIEMGSTMVQVYIFFIQKFSKYFYLSKLHFEKVLEYGRKL